MPINGKKIHAKSTGTTDGKQAKKFAYDYLGECLLKAQIADGTFVPVGEPAFKSENRFDRIVDQWLDRLEKEAKQDPRRHNHWHGCRSAALGHSGFVTFFGKEDVNAITTDRIRDFIAFKHEKHSSGQLAGTTIKRNIALLNVALKFAYEKRLLQSLPLMPKVLKKDTPRPWFEHAEYQHLHIAARAKAKAALKSGDEKLADEWNELSDFIIFMVGSFLRPSEWPFLQHKHVKFTEKAQNSYLTLTIIAGKTGKRLADTMHTSVAPYKRLVERNGKAAAAYVFKPAYLNRKTAQRRMADMFDTLLMDIGLKLDTFNERRSTYSLRHTALMLRLVKGDNVNLLLLAKNAGTSVDQLERFYLSHIKTAEMIDNLQSFAARKI